MVEPERTRGAFDREATIGDLPIAHPTRKRGTRVRMNPGPEKKNGEKE